VLSLVPLNFTINGVEYKAVAGVDCDRCGGVWLLPSQNGVECAPAKFCPYCGLEFVGYKSGGENHPFEEVDDG
jgi:hypothetical protein